jgi:hypothetical protein
MDRARAIELLAQIAEDDGQAGYARVNAIRTLLDALPTDQQQDQTESVAAARSLLRKLDGDERAA